MSVHHSFFFLLIVALFLSGCTQKKSVVEQPPAEEIQFIAPIGKKIATNLVTTLKGELQSAIQNEGVEQAISLCNVSALALTDSVAENSSFNVSIKRTSHKIRNPKNQADEYEKIALDLFQEIKENGDEMPEFYIQKITLNDLVQYNFYKPMKMENLCLMCHGDEHVRPVGISKMIRDLYPEDQAIGYKEGDFRGLIRIKFYEPAF